MLLAVATSAAAQEADERPGALVLSASRAYILRSASLTPLSARPGTILFSGDALKSDDGGSVTFVSCLDNAQQTLAADGDLLFEARGLRVRRGKLLDRKTTAGCFLPPLPRNIVASRQDAAAAVARDMSRDLSSGSFSQRVERLPDDRRNRLNAAMATVDAALKDRPADPVLHLARAELLNQYDLPLDAADEMNEVIAAWPDAGWARSRRFDLERQAARGIRLSEPKPEAGGNTYALLIGISEFQNAGVEKLQYAHADAIELKNLLESRRAGAVPESNIVLLENKKATRSAIQSAIETHLLARAGKDDTIVLFIASHGAAYLNKGYIVAYDSDPKDLATTGIPMDDVKKLFEERLSSVRRLLLYVDVCRAGKIGEIEPRADLINKSAENSLIQKAPAVFGMLAAQSSQLAYEGSEYGGGHGAFSYFLIDALNGNADADQTGSVTEDQLSLYVQSKVHEATHHKQLPKPIGDADETVVLARSREPGIDLKPFTGFRVTASRGLPSGPPTGEVSAAEQTGSLLQDFADALKHNRILPTEDRNAFAALAALRTVLSPAEFRDESEKLRVALENQGQQVLLQYLAGDGAPQKPEDFARGHAYFRAAETLTPDSVYLQSREFFCQGRLAIFDKHYDTAATLLERAVDLDPTRAYAYNALGISYLEQAQYDRAIPAFRDAAGRAPYWPYPLHNMALAYAEKGDYGHAIQMYRQAMQLAPKAVYLPYNLGLLYERMNRVSDAAKMYDQALKLDANNALVLNAQGSLRAAAGKSGEAEALYTRALQLDPALLPARYNLALLLAADSRRAPQAIALWRENLSRDANDLPSRLALAGALVQQEDYDDAASEYKAVLTERPKYVAAWLALAHIDVKTGHPEEALAQLQEALTTQPANPEILEEAAQVYLSLGRKAEAKTAYQEALRFSAKSARKRLLAALRKIG